MASALNFEKLRKEVRYIQSLLAYGLGVSIGLIALWKVVK